MLVYGMGIDRKKFIFYYNFNYYIVVEFKKNRDWYLFSFFE